MARSNTRHVNPTSVPPNAVRFSSTYRPSPSPSRPTPPTHSVRNEVPPLHRGSDRFVEFTDPQRSRDERIRYMEDSLNSLGVPPRRNGDDYEGLLDSFPIITRETPCECISMFPQWNYVPPKAG